MNEMKETKRQTEDAAQECHSAWDAICNKNVQKVSTKLTPFVTSALLFAGDIGTWLDDFGGVAHWK